MLQSLSRTKAQQDSSGGQKAEGKKMIFNDLREFIDRCQEMNDVQVVEGADWNLELGLITELYAKDENAPALLFDSIREYPKGFRVATNQFTAPRRTAMALGLPAEARGMELVKAWKDKWTTEGERLIPPVEVATGPVRENVLTGDDIDLLKFPVPNWHALDGGRYIGTADMVITRDRDEGWVNLGTHRVQVHDKATATIHTSPGRHCEMMARKYWDKGEACPVVVTCGQEPFLWANAHTFLPWGISEYDHAGGLRGAPYEVVYGEFTDIPIPATAEIALEGELLSPEMGMLEEGPFGEWPGHYGRGRHMGKTPIFKVKAIFHRNNPILLGAPPFIAPASFTVGEHIRRAANVWAEIERQVPGVKGVSVIQEAGTYWMLAISIQQQYPGHAKQAALAALGSNAGAYLLKYVVLVDEDIDPSNTADVLWAIASRTDPAESIDFVRGLWGSQTDPILSPLKRSTHDFTHSTAIIHACKPFHWKDQFPPSIRTDPKLLEQTKAKWSQLFNGVGERPQRNLAQT
ncbi:MAG: UbiD family decarboxylase [Hyphomicrobiales bacterium]|nr:UbiD family decarboxylase [Hyphomicrobiales bacterium]